MSDDKVLHFPVNDELPENPISTAKGGWRLCNHERISLEDHARTVRCVQCEKVLDPFDFLLKQSDLLQRAWNNHRYVNEKVAEKHKSLEALTAEERRLKARVSRLKEKAGPVLDFRAQRPL